jgi:hypothetical protein
MRVACFLPDSERAGSEKHTRSHAVPDEKLRSQGRRKEAKEIYRKAGCVIDEDTG